MIHDQKGKLNFQPYGQSVEEVIYSISRAKLNQELMSLAESTGKISIFFEHKLLDCDFENKILHFDRKEIKFNKVFGSDGSNSIIRDQIIHNTCARFIHKPLGHGYKDNHANFTRRRFFAKFKLFIYGQGRFYDDCLA